MTTGLRPEDDDLHDIGDRWWATETCWFAFHNAERKLGGWLYALIRPNIGTCQGGVWIWDEKAWSPFEVPYYSNFSSARLPPARNLRDMKLPVGWSIQVLQPLTRYRLSARDADQLQLDLQFEATMKPQVMGEGTPPFLSAAHFDQFGRVRGELVLHGEHIPIDCLSVRDRSWGPRPETRPRRLSYDFGVASADHGFLCTTNPHDTSGDVITHGFLLRDGVVFPLAEGQRTVHRDGEGQILGEVIQGVDTGGRAFRAEGESLSHIAINRHTAVTWTALMTWSLDGDRAYGEDQDMWPVHEWSAFRRGSRSH